MTNGYRQLILAGVLLAPLAAAQGPSPEALLKHPIDRALAHLYQAVGAKRIAASRTPVLHAARYLVASSFCHRQYTEEDGPLIRNFVTILIANRQTSGGFHSRFNPQPKLATAWAVQALAGLDREAYGPTIQVGLKFIRQRGGEAKAASLPFDALVASYARQLSGRPAKERQATLMGWITALIGGQKPDGSWPAGQTDALDETLDRVVKLVALEQIVLGRHPVAKADVLPTWLGKGVDYLISRQNDGKWTLAGGPHPGITALCLRALLVKPEGRRSPVEKQVIDRSLKYLLGEQGENGSFSASGTPVYVTSAVVQAFMAANRPELRPAIDKAMKYLLMMQNVEGKGYAMADRDFGSLGYGGDNRGDMSNLQMALDALRSAGLPKEDEALEKALVFIQRSQNRVASNDYKGTRRGKDKVKRPVRSGNDGGGVYYPGNTNAGYRNVGGTLIPRSYGSMTWALLKCYILCNIDRNDPRILDAWRWIQENYTLEENPGFSPELKAQGAHYQGLFYYYLTMARTLSLMGLDTIQVVTRETPAERAERERLNAGIAANPQDKRQPVKPVATRKDRDGSPITFVLKPRKWRQELLARLQKVQQADGSWVNKRSSRWMEGNPVLTTAYALIAAAHALDNPVVVKPRR